LHGRLAQRQPNEGNASTAMQSTNGITPKQVYKLGAESLGWNKSTTAGKALIAALAKGNKKSPWIYHPKI